MYTIIRKLAMVCLAVVFSVLVYGCGGGGSGQAETTTMTDEPGMPHSVSTASVSDGLTITPGEYNIPPGETADAGDATFACPAGELSCDVTVTVAEDGSTTVESVGGMATAMNSASATARLAVMAAEDARDAALAAAMAAEKERDAALEELRLANLRANPNDVDLSDLLSGYMTMTAGTYNIEPGDDMDVDDVNFACLADGLACEVIVDEDGTVVSAGGEATAQNSMAAMTTRAAIALYAPNPAGDKSGALETQSMTGPVIDLDDDHVVRSPEGVTTITLEHADTANTNEYTSKAVDAGHEIPGWMGQTLTRDDSAVATMNVEAIPATGMDEATIYTNIDPAERGKAVYEGAAIAATGMRIAVDADQEYPAITNSVVMDGATFRGEFVRMDSTRLTGTFTCDLDAGCALDSTTQTLVGILVLANYPATGWEFESDENEKEGETQDADYMYFGYWLNSPVGSSLDYEFDTLYEGSQKFAMDDLLRDNMDAITATYEGGAAGRYVTRALLPSVQDGGVDPFSPGSHGRFTAKAKLKAYFGSGTEFAADAMTDTPLRANSIEGTIAEFMDGDTELGFGVTLGLTQMMADGTVAGTGTATSTFNSLGDTTGMGNWGAQLYGASPATNATDPVKNRTLPSGVAGEFDVDSLYTKIVGTFAAEKQ